MIETASVILFGSMSIVLLMTTLYLFWKNRKALFG
jgi:cbb3-type cytochrome oxidase subunit 3